MPAKFLESVLLGLRSASLLESKVGAGGGYKLSRPPEQIRISEIVAALEPESGAETTARTETISIGQSALEVFHERSDEALAVVGDLSLVDLVNLADERTSDDSGSMYYI